jgi:hypothetical protein
MSGCFMRGVQNQNTTNELKVTIATLFATAFVLLLVTASAAEGPVVMITDSTWSLKS